MIAEVGLGTPEITVESVVVVHRLVVEMQREPVHAGWRRSLQPQPAGMFDAEGDGDGVREGVGDGDGGAGAQ